MKDDGVEEVTALDLAAVEMIELTGDFYLRQAAGWRPNMWEQLGFADQIKGIIERYVAQVIEAQKVSA